MSADDRMRQLKRRAEEQAQVELLRWEERHDPIASSLDVDLVLVRAIQSFGVRGPGLDKALRWYLAGQRLAPQDVLVRIRTVARGSRGRAALAEAEATFARAPRRGSSA